MRATVYLFRGRWVVFELMVHRGPRPRVARVANEVELLLLLQSILY